jgi:hypothetical protein
LSRCSYFAPKEGDATYDQQHPVFLKLERLFLRIVNTTILVDPLFIKDICISLFSNPLALKFKQSYADSKPQNGQIKVPDSQTPDFDILNLESPDFQNLSSQIHRSQEGERPRDDTDPRFQFMDGLLYYQGLLYIPDGPCQFRVFQSHHDFSTAGHFGFNKTMELISRDFWWPQM